MVQWHVIVWFTCITVPLRIQGHQGVLIQNLGSNSLTVSWFRIYIHILLCLVAEWQGNQSKQGNISTSLGGDKHWTRHLHVGFCESPALVYCLLNPDSSSWDHTLLVPVFVNFNFGFFLAPHLSTPPWYPGSLWSLRTSNCKIPASRYTQRFVMVSLERVGEGWQHLY